MRLWNFRKFGLDKDSNKFDIKKPHLEIRFNENLNVLIGENDSGKSSIMDAIKLVLKTHSYEYIRVTEDDFYVDKNGKRSDRFRIELEFRGFSDEEAKNFIEWLSWEGTQEKAEPYLKVNYDVTRTPNRILPSDIKAGKDEEGSTLSAEARYYLRTTYLKPLRDAESELVCKRNSRLSQIVRGHEIFDNEEENLLYKKFKSFNNDIKKYFSPIDDIGNEDKEEHEGYKIKEIIDEFIHGFYNKDSEIEFKTPDENIKDILESLTLAISGVEKPGLGTLNRLFMAAELLHLSKEKWDGLKLGLIEELEAHLHPQVQLKVIETLQEKKGIQFILTTHSPNLASKVKLENLIICTNNSAFPMGSEYTELDKSNYAYLEKFLDVTKSNLFFARGVILVEGWSEEILIPVLARNLGYNLTEYEVSVVNVGNLGFDHYYRIFLRKNNEKPDQMGIPVAVVRDLDIREYEKSKEHKENNENCENKKPLDIERVKNYKEKCIEERLEREKEITECKLGKKNEEGINQSIIRPFISPEWTLEWCLFKSKYLKEFFMLVLSKVHINKYKKVKSDVDYEEKLANDLIRNSLNKTKLANGLAHLVDNTYPFDNDTEEAYFKERVQESLSTLRQDVKDNKYKEDTISYLIEAIKYVCENQCN